MNPERWRQIDDLYDQVRKMAPEERGEFFTELGRRDSDLRREVESLVAQDVSGSMGLLDRPACEEFSGLSQQLTFQSLQGEQLGPYAIEALLGAGGMGRVYKAQDTRLGRPVAIKVCAEQFSGQFEREARAISALNHPHICTLYDAGPNYLVMELLEGETLTALLRHGPLPLELTVRYGTEIGEALAAAHEQRIIHRDLKPANIFVTRFGTKVLDFGLAKFILPDDESAGVSRVVMGTPSYMAPEQSEGRDCDARTDIFSLGLILYEMATGRRMRASGRQTGALDGLSGNFGRIVERCLQRDPDKRWQSARELVSALSSEALPGNSRNFRWKVLAASMALILAVLAIWVSLSLRRTAIPRDEAPVRAAVIAPPRRPSIAVLGFNNLSGQNNQNWIARALAHLLSTQLGAGDALRIIPGENVAQIMPKRQLQTADIFGSEMLVKICDYLGADLVVFGSYLLSSGPAGRQLRVDYRVQNSRTKDQLIVGSHSGSEMDLPDLVTRVGDNIRAQLRLPKPSNSISATSRALPSDLRAARLYSEALSRLWSFDALHARTLLEKAATIEPNYPPIHIALAQAWSALGYDSNAKAAASRAVALLREEPRAERLSVEANYHLVHGEWEKAIRVFQTLWTLFPDDIAHGLALARAQVFGGQPKAALATVEMLRERQRGAIGNPRIHLAEAAAAFAVSDFTASHLAAARAVGRVDSQAAPLLAAEALWYQARALYRLGSPEKALALYRQAQRLYSAARDTAGTARMMLGIGTLLAARSDIKAAEEMFDNALKVLRSVGDQNGLASGLNSLAALASRKGDRKAAMDLYEQAAEIYRIAGNKTGIAGSLFGWGSAAGQLGDVRKQRALYEQSVAICRETADKSGLARALNGLGGVLRQEGDIDAAVRTYRDALSLHRETGDKGGTSAVLNNIGNALTDMGSLREALRTYEESSVVSRELNDRRATAGTTANIAGLHVTIGRLKKGHELFEQSLAVLREAADKDAVTSVTCRLGTVLYMRGYLDKAANALNECLSAARSTGNTRLSSGALSQLGWVAFLRGDHRNARNLFDEAIQTQRMLRINGSLAATQLQLARIALDEGKIEEAELRTSEAVAPYFQLEKILYGQAFAEAVIGRIRLAQGRYSEAQAAVDRGVSLTASIESETIRLHVLVAQGTVYAKTAPASQALAVLQSTRETAKKMGFLPVELETRLVMEGIGVADHARGERLMAIEREASAHGIGLLAGKARRLRELLP